MDWSAFDWGVIVGVLIGAFGTILLYVTDDLFGLVDWIVDKLDDWVEKAGRL